MKSRGERRQDARRIAKPGKRKLASDQETGAYLAKLHESANKLKATQELIEYRTDGLGMVGERGKTARLQLIKELVAHYNARYHRS